MSYRNTILHRPGEKYPFLLATESDGIPLTREELETLKTQIEVALREEYEAMQADLPPHKRDGYAEQMHEQADMRRKQLREEGK